jgi:antiviral helicase SKI2
VNPPIQTGLTSTSSDRRPAPNSNFVRGKSGYAPFWPGGLDSMVAKPSDKDSVSGTRGLRTIPPGLKRGLRLSAEKNRDSTSSELHDLDGYETEAESPVTNISWSSRHFVNSRICNSPKYWLMGLKSNLPQKLCQANLQTLITYYRPRYHPLPEYL